VSWRNPGIVHKKNEIFLDVVEKLNLLVRYRSRCRYHCHELASLRTHPLESATVQVASNGTVLRSEIMGALKMRSFLSGMPELKLGLNDKLLMEARGALSSCPRSFCQPVRFVCRDTVVGFCVLFLISACSPLWLIAGMFSRWFTAACAGGPKGKGVEMEDVRFHQCVRLSR
jgi:AP-1 complex subunit mu